MTSRISDRVVFEFDLQGYVIFNDFFSRALVDTMNAIIDRQPRPPGNKFLFMTLDPVFLDIMVDPRILSLCNAWIDPHFRFDHAWGVQWLTGRKDVKLGENLHAGPFENQKFFQYHWHDGRPVCSCLVFTVVLEAQRPGEGGLIFVPGSHKSNVNISNYRVFNEFCERDLAGLSWIHQPELNPGDLLVMSEAVIHGTQSWVPEGRRRRNLYYKYGCSFMTWPPADAAETIALRKAARSDLERRLLEPPYVSQQTPGNLDNIWRPVTYPEDPPKK